MLWSSTMRRAMPLLSLFPLLLLTGCFDRIFAPPDDPPPDCFDCCIDSECFPPELDPSRSLPPFAQAETPPPPLSGGTLLVDGDRAVVADPDRDAVHLVSLASGEPAGLVQTTELEPGDEPGRVIRGADAYFVALRSGDAVAQLDLDLAVTARYDVCSSPRGVAASETTLFVACLQGDLVTIDTLTGEVLERRDVGDDLRDVVVGGEYLYVSHFRSASVSVVPLAGDGTITEIDILPHEDFFRGGIDTPSVAYRMIEHEGRVVVLHQLASNETTVQISVSGGYGGFDCTPGIVQAGVTIIEGTAVMNTAALGNLVLPVDIAVDGTTDRVLIAAAGSRTDDPVGPGRFEGGARAPAVAEGFLSDFEISPSLLLGCGGGLSYDDGRRVTSVGYTDDGRAVALTRAPSELHVIGTDERVALPGADVYDVGHELFFGDSGAGIACASCHAEGSDDGLVWRFEGIGPRRTQFLRGGILGSEPFHWDGDMTDFRHLAREVFSGRMMGPELPDEYADALAAYIDGMPVPAHGDGVDPLAAERGRVIFESSETQCSLCHSGPRLSNPASFDVGTGGVFQVPSLVGVSLRAPYIHTGCADTLDDRFDPSCGGVAHGTVSHLAPDELDDLIAYLETI
jgi:hypothetical protein